MAWKVSHSPRGYCGALGRGPQRFHRVGIAVHGVPCRHQAAGLRKAEEQDAVHGRECLLVDHLERRRASGASAFSERGEQSFDGLMHPISQPCADALPVCIGCRDDGRKRRARSRQGRGAHTLGGSEHRQETSRPLTVSGGLEVELDVPARERTPGVEHAEVSAIEQEAPARVPRDAVSHGGSPRRIQRSTPGREHEGSREIGCFEHGTPGRVAQRLRPPQREPEQFRQGGCCNIGQRAGAGRGAAPRIDGTPPPAKTRRNGRFRQWPITSEQARGVRS